ncbi:unnamed protein product [Callosobruchus maculatus]|uniref:Uncharacterized protein n=1 Tax=Callosobruchus maculatus TaxID=64391 RepID=A0A653CMH2_CALMS|nr:unnamed protein product [Callosobruchus maculatus]
MDRFLIKKQEISEAPSTSSDRVDSVPEEEKQSERNSVDQIETENEPQKKKRKFLHHFQTDWLTQFPWVEQRKNDAFCKCCDTSVVGGTSHLKRHDKSTKHIRKFNESQSNVKIDTFVRNEAQVKHAKMVYSGELKMVMLLHEHNLPFMLMEHLPKLIASVCPDSKIAKGFNCNRTKATAITSECLASESLRQIRKSLSDENKFYSLIIDETTDISTRKSLVIMIRFFYEHRVRDKFFSLVEVQSATAESLFNAVMEILNQNKISVGNMLGFAADNANVMMGLKAGVQAKFKEINKNIFVLGCTCHSLHLCSSAACMKLPKTIEEFARNLYNHFSNSPKRIGEFEGFQEFTNLKPQKMLRPSQTRWLSLQAVVDRILVLWDALRLYFTN